MRYATVEVVSLTWLPTHGFPARLSVQFGPKLQSPLPLNHGCRSRGLYHARRIMFVEHQQGTVCRIAERKNLTLGSTSLPRGEISRKSSLVKCHLVSIGSSSAKKALRGMLRPLSIFFIVAIDGLVRFCSIVKDHLAAVTLATAASWRCESFRASTFGLEPRARVKTHASLADEPKLLAASDRHR